LVCLEANPGKEADVAAFLQQGLALAQQEASTPVWFALRLGPSTFGVFDAFADEAGRQAHLNGPIAQALMAQAPNLLASPPVIERIDVLGAKLPQSAGSGTGEVVRVRGSASVSRKLTDAGPQRVVRVLRDADVLGARTLRPLPALERHRLAFAQFVETRAAARRLVKEVLGAVACRDEPESLVSQPLDRAVH